MFSGRVYELCAVCCYYVGGVCVGVFDLSQGS
jgi:hypothetical protein